MAVSAEDLGLKLMIDPQDYVVLCNKGQEKEDNKIIYIALRTEFSNILLEDDIALLPLAFANIENNEVRLFHDVNGQVANTIFMYKKKSDSLYVIMPIMIFILCGFDHCIANMYYFAINPVPALQLRTLFFFIINIIGNSIGSIEIRYLLNGKL